MSAAADIFCFLEMDLYGRGISLWPRVKWSGLGAKACERLVLFNDSIFVYPPEE